jgi:hypothetical protein
MTSLVEELAQMQIGDSIGMGQTEVLGVPGGWIFTTTHKAGVTSCFVPLPQNQVEMPKLRNAIITPGGVSH